MQCCGWDSGSGVYSDRVSGFSPEKVMSKYGMFGICINEMKIL
jgi:hypothetical protein